MTQDDINRAREQYESLVHKMGAARSIPVLQMLNDRIFGYREALITLGLYAELPPLDRERDVYREAFDKLAAKPTDAAMRRLFPTVGAK